MPQYKKKTNDYLAYIKFSFDFSSFKDVLLSHKKNLNDLVRSKIATELERGIDPFIDPETNEPFYTDFQPRKHFDSVPDETVKAVYRLAQLLFKGRNFPLINLYIYRARIGFKAKDYKILETAVYELVETSMLIIDDYVYSNGAVYTYTRPNISLHRPRVPMTKIDHLNDRRLKAGRDEVKRNTIMKGQSYGTETDES